jgi:hypothetical protein
MNEVVENVQEAHLRVIWAIADAAIPDTDPDFFAGDMSQNAPLSVP